MLIAAVSVANVRHGFRQGSPLGALALASGLIRHRRLAGAPARKGAAEGRCGAGHVASQPLSAAAPILRASPQRHYLAGRLRLAKACPSLHQLTALLEKVATAGKLISKGSASSVTEHSPERRRARMARRVGSASAANVVLN